MSFPLCNWTCFHVLLPHCSGQSSIAVDTSLLQWTLDCGTIPLVCPVGRDSQGRSVMLDPTEVTAVISRALQPHKVMFLNISGGLRSRENKVLLVCVGLCVVQVLLQYMYCAVCVSIVSFTDLNLRNTILITKAFVKLMLNTLVCVPGNGHCVVA